MNHITFLYRAATLRGQQAHKFNDFSRGKGDRFSGDTIFFIDMAEVLQVTIGNYPPLRPIRVAMFGVQAKV